MSTHLPDYLVFSDRLTDDLSYFISQINPDRVGLLVDENTAEKCLPLVDISPDVVIQIESGEANKHLGTCEKIWEELTSYNFSRNSLLINLGGGVIGDMGGFAAATFKRGMPFINIPTTLLAQVDASIGGKLGVDFGGLKNHIGVFKEPDKVIIHRDFLETLPEKELVSGYAEVIKHALIFDESHWDYLEHTPFDQLDWTNIIRRSVEIKSEIVKNDPYERGLRKILNFGHTLGHAIESHFLSTAKPLLHGEAVALGMILESDLSKELGLISTSEYDRISHHIFERFDLPKEIPTFDLIERPLRQDKKNMMGEIKCSLLKGIGHCSYDLNVSDILITGSLEAYNQMKRS